MDEIGYKICVWVEKSKIKKIFKKVGTYAIAKEDAMASEKEAVIDELQKLKEEVTEMIKEIFGDLVSFEIIHPIADYLGSFLSVRPLKRLVKKVEKGAEKHAEKIISYFVDKAVDSIENLARKAMAKLETRMG